MLDKNKLGVRASPVSPASPLGISDGFGKDIISAVQVHYPVFQVELPFVLTSVDLRSEEEEEEKNGRVQNRGMLLELTLMLHRRSLPLKKSK